MRVFLDLIDNVTNTVRAVLGLIVLCIMGFGLVMSFGTSYVVPTAIEGMADKANEAKERQLELKQEASRDEALAEEGWGYDAGGQLSSTEPSRSDEQDGWAED